MTIGDIITTVGGLINKVIPLLISVGVVYFVWGVVQFVIADGEEAKTKGRDHMIYGIVGLMAIFSMWGLVNIITKTFGINSGDSSVATQFINSNNSIVSSTGACELTTGAKLGDLLNYGTCTLVKSVIPLIIGLAMAMFIWGVVQYVINTDEEASKEKGKQFMLWGIIGLTVMVGVWGFVKIVGSTFKIEYAIPQVRTK